MMPLAWSYLGRVPYDRGVLMQETIRDQVLAGTGPERLLLLEHDPVITIGRNADRSHVTASVQSLEQRGVQLCQSSRGGDVTYHGPGQLMVYAIVRMRHGVVQFLESVASALALAATELGAPGARWRRDPAGLWVGDAKLAACGLHIRRRVPIHGFALDVATPTDAWQLIVPCGLTSTRVTSIAALSGAQPPPTHTVAHIAAPRLCRALGREPVQIDCPTYGESDTMATFSALPKQVS